MAGAACQAARRPWVTPSPDLLDRFLLAIDLENVHVVHVEGGLHLVPDAEGRAGVDAPDEGHIPADQMDEDLVAHQLRYIHLCFDRGGTGLRRHERRVVHVFWAYAEDHLFPDVSLIGWGPGGGHAHGKALGFQSQPAVGTRPGGREEVHRRRADEAGAEDIARMIVETLRGVHLLHQATFANRDA